MKKHNKRTSLPFMNSFRRFIAFSVALVLIVASLSFSNSYAIRNAEEVDSVDSLSGQRIGCCVGWETDYILTGRDDITLMRYDDNATAFVALSFNQVDAVGVDAATFSAIRSVTEGLDVLPQDLGTIGDCIVAPLEKKELCDELDRFLEDFRSGPEYEDFVSRGLMEKSDSYISVEIPENKDGRVLKVGYSPDEYPLAYYDTVSGKPQGAGIEILRRFAYENGYRVEFQQVSSDSAGVMVTQNMLDLCLAGMTDVYRDEYEGVLCMSQPYIYNKVLLVKVAEGKKFELNGEIKS